MASGLDRRKAVAQVNFPGGGGSTDWASITGKPSTFPPDSHSHPDAVAAGAAGFMSGADKTKLNGIATGATANSSDAALRDRSTHTGTQDAATITGTKLASFISDFAAAVAALITGKANTVHTHVIADTTGLQTALDGKQAVGSYAAASHTHTASQVTDFSEAVDDRVAALVVAGANMTVTYDDVANTLTLASTGGGGGGSGPSPAISWVI